MHSLHISFHLVVGVGVTSVSDKLPEILYNIARHDCSCMNKYYNQSILKQT